MTEDYFGDDHEVIQRLRERATLSGDDPYLRDLAVVAANRLGALLAQMERLTEENFDYKLNLQRELRTRVVGYGVTKEQIASTHEKIDKLLQLTTEIHRQVTQGEQGRVRWATFDPPR